MSCDVVGVPRLHIKRHLIESFFCQEGRKLRAEQSGLVGIVGEKIRTKYHTYSYNRRKAKLFPSISPRVSREIHRKPSGSQQ